MTTIEKSRIHFQTTDVKCREITLRRRQARASEDINGIDYVEVKIAQVQRTGKKLTKIQQSSYRVILYLLKPAVIDSQNVEIDGLDVQEVIVPGYKSSETETQVGIESGHLRRSTKFQILVTGKDGEIHPQKSYKLKLHRHNNLVEPLPGFDPLLSDAEFSFEPEFPAQVKTNNNEWDIPALSPCPPQSLDEPEIDYLAKDYASFRQLALDRLSLIMPKWRERHVPDLALVEVLAYAGDHLSYYQDAVATEAYLQTARQRISVRRHARLVDYHLHEGCNARALLCLTVGMAELDLDLQNIYFITDYDLQFPLATVTSGEHELKEKVRREQYEIFEPVEQGKKTLYAEHNRILFYNWGKQRCCLPKGATHATIKDGPLLGSPVPVAGMEMHEEELLCSQLDEARTLRLQAGDILLFEEILDPGTGKPEDANPAHRHAVRLTSVRHAYDLAGRQALLAIKWDPKDELPFPLCLSAITSTCEPKEDISVVRGNIILVDHGETVKENLKQVISAKPELTCDDCGEATLPASCYNPQVSRHPLVFREEIQPTLSIETLMQNRDPRTAVPQIKLTEVDELLIVERFFDELKRDEDVPIHDAPDILKAFVRTLDEKENLSLAARAKAWEFKDQLKHWLHENPHTTLPSLLHKCSEEAERLRGMLFSEADNNTWLARNDLLSSRGEDHDFVVEVDDNGTAQLRFGDDELGKRPEANTQFCAQYRIGEALAGNVGAETIRRMFARNGIREGILDVRNPLPATGGAAPESLEDAKLSAPYAFRYQPLQRAIKADDYASLAEKQFPEIQKAFAVIEKSNRKGRYNVKVWYDLLSGARLTPDQVKEHLQHFRRIGHDLDVRQGELVLFTVSVSVKIQVQAIWETVRDALHLALGEKGFFNPDNLTFKTEISLSQLAAAVQLIPGVAYVNCITVESAGRQEIWPKLKVKEAGKADTDMDTDMMKFQPHQIPKLAKLVIEKE